MNTYLNIKKYSDDASQYTVQSGTNLCVLWWCPDFVQLVFFSWLILACIWHLLTLHSFKQHERLDQWLGVWGGGAWGGGACPHLHTCLREEDSLPLFVVWVWDKPELRQTPIVSSPRRRTNILHCEREYRWAPWPGLARPPAWPRPQPRDHTLPDTLFPKHQ